MKIPGFVVQEIPGGPALANARAAVDALPLLEAYLVHADLDPSLEEDTRVFLAFDVKSGDLRGVATVYSGLGMPALAATTLPAWDPDVASTLLRSLKESLDRSGPEGPWLSIDDASREPAWRDAFMVRDRWEELHYLLAQDHVLPADDEARVELVPAAELPRLDAFLKQHGAQAWSRRSYTQGFYVWVKEKDEVLAAAGIHFVTPVVGQIANVLVRPEARGKGLGKLVTTGVARRIRASGKIVSLFVRADNTSAIGLYEKLGFKRVRKLVGLELV